MNGIHRRDDARHEAGEALWWTETFRFDAWTSDGLLGATACLTLVPNQRRAWYWAALVRADTPLVSVIDLEVPLPRRGLELRAEALWADHICEEPLDAWSVLNEAFGVSLDDPDDAFRDARGVPTPVAFDLGFDADSPPVGSVNPERGSFVQPCAVHGEILVATDRLVFDGPGVRHRRWGDDRWWEHLDDVREGRRHGLRSPVPLVVDGRPYRIERTLGRDAAGTLGWSEWVEKDAAP